MKSSKVGGNPSATVQSSSNRPDLSDMESYTQSKLMKKHTDMSLQQNMIEEKKREEDEDSTLHADDTKSHISNKLPKIF